MILKLSEIGRRIGKKPKPDGAIYWLAEDIPGSVKAVREILAERQPASYAALDGVMPHSLCLALVAAIADVTTPAILDRNYDNGVVKIPTVSTTKAGEVLSFRWCETDTGDFTVVQFAFPGGFITPAQLPDVSPPSFNPTKGIVLAGHGPYWLTATLGLAYRHHQWVAVRHPGKGATIAIASSDNYRPGAVLPEIAVQEAVLGRVLPKRGEIWLFDSPGGPHPGVIVSREKRNALSADVMVIPLTSNIALHKGNISCVAIPAGFYGLERDSIALCQKLTTVSKDALIGGRPLGRVEAALLAELIKRVRYALDDPDLDEPLRQLSLAG